MRGVLETASGLLQGKRRLVLVSLLTLTFICAASAAYAAKPTAPTARDAYPTGGNQVQVQWLASVDASGHPLTYEVYRSKVPITAAMIAPVMSPLVSVVTPASLTPAGSTWTAIVNANVAGGEVADVYTWYYAVRARDSLGTYSALSGAVAPNLHGYRMSDNVYSCQRCHSVHGAPTPPGVRDTSSWICYYCHGRADGSSAGGGDRSTLNTKADFYDYANLPAGGSQHRSAKMTATNQQCRACHTPHRASYYYSSPDGVSVVYDPVQSFRMLLRAQTGLDAALKPTYANGYYSRNDVTAENTSFCFSCHGSAAASPADGSAETNMGYVSDGGYVATGGDHNESGYAAAVHGPAVIYSNDYVPSDPSADDPKPQVQCLVCHDNHASAADKLIAYRGVDTAATTSGTYAQAELCYACHSAGTSENRVASGYSAPYAWNGRDVKAQFAKASRHPTTARTGSEPAVAGSWAQTTEADFVSGTLQNVSVVGGPGDGARVELQSIGGAAAGIFSDTFASGDFSAWSAVGTYWQVDGASGSTLAGGSGAPSARGYATSTTRRTAYLDTSVNLAGRSTIRLQFSYRTVGLDGSATGDLLNAQYSTNGTTWTTLVTYYDANAPWTRSASFALPANATTIRFTSSVNAVGEYVYIDDVTITADPIPFTYEAHGSVTSGVIESASGPLESWTGLTFSGSQPTGSQVLVDVLDGASDTPLMTDLHPGMSQPISLASIDKNAHPTLKLRSRLLGDSTLPAVVADDFNHDPDVPATNFDTVKWTDAFLNGSTDPDSGAPVPATLFSDGFETGIVPPWDSATITRTTTNPRSGTYAAGHAYAGSGARETRAAEVDVDLTGITSPTIRFWYRHDAFSSTTDYVRVFYSTTGLTGTYTQLWTTTSTGTLGWTQTPSLALPAGTNAIRVSVSVNANGERAYVDDVVIAGLAPAAPTDDWPNETAGALRLRAEGTAFGGTADEGEFVYLSPSQAGWVMGEDFDAVVRIPAVSNLAGGTLKAGLMIRTASSEANALQPGAAMAGMYVTNTNLTFQYRGAAGGTTATGGSAAGAPPEWLRLERRGTSFTAKVSDDGSSWTTVGSANITTGTTVLVGLSLTSSVSNTFSEATFDDFAVTGVAPPSSVTPALNDWSVSYLHYPLPAIGSLTCANCHNVHAVQRGATSPWQLSRVSTPSNTKNTYAGSATAYCLECHDGSTPEAAVTADVLVPYTVEFSDKRAAAFFAGWNKTAAGADFGTSSHGSLTSSRVPNMQAGCENCHDPHASDNARLTAFTITGGSGANHPTATRNNTSTYAEERLCYGCHGSARTPNCSASGCHTTAMDAVNAQTPFAGTYRHPVGDFSGRHSDTEGASDLGPAAGDRHAECADCHDPHAAKTGLHTQGDSTAGPALRGAVGLKPTYGPAFTGAAGQDWATMNKATGWTPERISGTTTVDDADHEAYVCLKCHSSYSGQPFSITSNGRTYTSTDVAMEFNPSNMSEHNVFGQRSVMETAFTVNGTTYTWSKPADSAFLRTGWTAHSEMTCTDCHTNSGANAKGPHGSSTPWMIATGYTTWTNTTSLTQTSPGMPATLICNKCHTNLQSANVAHAEHDDRGNEGGYCRFCHVKVPHGWKRPRLIGYTGDDAAYATIPNGINRISLKNYTPTNWNEADCGAACDSGRHPASGTRWP